MRKLPSQCKPEGEEGRGILPRSPLTPPWEKNLKLQEEGPSPTSKTDSSVLFPYRLVVKFKYVNKAIHKNMLQNEML